MEDDGGATGGCSDSSSSGGGDEDSASVEATARLRGSDTTILPTSLLDDDLGGDRMGNLYDNFGSRDG
jgi:hypothetical protein